MTDTGHKEGPRLKERMEAICLELIDKGILYSEALGQFERCFIIEVVRRNDGNLMRAARELGIHRNTLAQRMSRYKRRRN
jgi:DNA-binding NtrC family response regulator